MKREKLKTKDLLNGDGFGYKKDEADKVMDAMERRIARLFNLVDGYKRNSLGLSAMYNRRLDSELERIVVLEAKNREDYINYQHKTQEQAKRIAELESQLHEVTPKWISVNDRLPEDGACVLCCNGFGVQSVAIYANQLGFFNDGDDLWVTHWMPLPSAPTTEESSVT